MHRNDRADTIKLIAIFAGAIAATAAIMFLQGCGSISMLPRPRRIVGDARVEAVAVSPACMALDRDVAGFTATSIALGALSGGSGLGSLFTSSTSRYVVGGVGVGLGTFGAVFAYLSTYFAASYARQCTTQGAP